MPNGFHILNFGNQYPIIFYIPLYTYWKGLKKKKETRKQTKEPIAGEDAELQEL